MVLGTYLLGCYLAVVSFLFSERFTAGDRTIEPDTALARQILIVGGVTIVASVALAVRYFGVADGLRMIGREAWPGLLAGAGLGLITGAPLRAFVSTDASWLVLAPLYVGGVLLIRWFALRVPPDHRP